MTQLSSPSPSACPDMRSLNVPVHVLDHGLGLSLPAYQTPDSAGMDLMAALDENDSIILQPLQRALVPTGLQIALPRGYEAQIRPRSGLALRHGIGLVNSPGTIDADYRGEIKVLMINLGQDPFPVVRGLRIAQMVIAPVVQAHLRVVADLDETARGTGGFGSTGFDEAPKV